MVGRHIGSGLPSGVRACPTCGVTFVAGPQQIYCSRRHRMRGWRAIKTLEGTHGPVRLGGGRWGWGPLERAVTEPRAVVWQHTTEQQWADAVVRWAKRNGWRVYFTRWSLRSPAGFPDLVLCRPPRLIFVELKRESGRTTPKQDEWLADLQACGFLAEVWRPHDETRVQKILLEGAA